MPGSGQTQNSFSSGLMRGASPIGLTPEDKNYVLVKSLASDIHLHPTKILPMITLYPKN